VPCESLKTRYPMAIRLPLPRLPRTDGRAR